MLAALNVTFGPGTYNLPPADVRFDVRHHVLEMQSTSLAYSHVDAAVQLKFGTPRPYRQPFCLAGGAYHSAGLRRVEVTPTETLVANSEEQMGFASSGDRYNEIMLRVEPAALNRKLSAWVGAQPNGSLAFEGSTNLRKEGQRLRRFVFFLVRELDSSEFPVPPALLAEYEQALMVHFLCGNHHNFSYLLDRQPMATAPWQVCRVEEYIEGSWNKPITIEALASVAGASARSIFKCFKRARGYSPMAFVRQVRLRHARQMLQLANAETSVTSVAFACGFQNHGHFAKYYRGLFGELPSETLNRAKAQ